MLADGARRRSCSLTSSTPTEAELPHREVEQPKEGSTETDIPPNGGPDSSSLQERALATPKGKLAEPLQRGPCSKWGGVGSQLCLGTEVQPTQQKQVGGTEATGGSHLPHPWPLDQAAPSPTLGPAYQPGPNHSWVGKHGVAVVVSMGFGVSVNSTAHTGLHGYQTPWGSNFNS